MGLKIYLAAPFADKDKMAALATQFEAAGHTITQAWWIHETKTGYDRPPAEIAAWALKDYFGVDHADVVVLFSTGFSEGKAVEQGVAIAQEKPIIAVGTLGEFRNIFHYLPNYFWVKDVGEAITAIPDVWLRWNKARGK